MKIIYSRVLVILFLLCAFSFVYAAETRITQLFVTDQGEQYRHDFFYNDIGTVILETRYNLSGGEWVRKRQREWLYGTNGIGNKITQVERVFENGNFVNTDEIELKYNYINKEEEEITYQYISGVKASVKRKVFEYSNQLLSKMSEYTYSNDNAQLSIVNTFEYNNDKIAKQLTEIYSVGGLVDSTFISSFTYNSSGKIKTQLLKKKVGDNYQNTDSITWFYNSEEMLISQRLKMWNVKNNNWENSQIINYEYDASLNLIAETYQQWVGMYWKNIYRYEYQYENGTQIQRTLMTQLYEEWRNLISISYNENNDEKVIKSEYDFWGGDKGELTTSYIPFDFNGELVIMQAETIRVNYGEMSTTTDVNNTSLLIKIYPNPSDGIFYLNTEKHEILSWNVYDLKGQLVRSHVQKYNTGVIDLTDLQDGIYILRVETTLGNQQEKLIKRK